MKENIYYWTLRTHKGTRCRDDVKIVTIHLIQKFHLFSIQLIPSSNLKKCMMMIEQIALQALRLSRSSRKTLYIHFIMNSARIGADDSLRSSQ